MGAFGVGCAAKCTQNPGIARKGGGALPLARIFFEDFSTMH